MHMYYTIIISCTVKPAVVNCDHFGTATTVIAIIIIATPAIDYSNNNKLVTLVPTRVISNTSNNSNNIFVLMVILK